MLKIHFANVETTFSKIILGKTQICIKWDFLSSVHKGSRWNEMPSWFLNSCASLVFNQGYLGCARHQHKGHLVFLSIFWDIVVSFFAFLWKYKTCEWSAKIKHSDHLVTVCSGPKIEVSMCFRSSSFDSMLCSLWHMGGAMQQHIPENRQSEQWLFCALIGHSG